MKLSVITPTHDPRWLRETWQSLERQTHADFEWVVLVNGQATVDAVRAVLQTSDRRVRIEPAITTSTAIGALKQEAFLRGTGEVLVELDHDDLLASNALERLAATFGRHDSIGFVYSDAADFSPTGAAVTYHDPEVRRSWEANGWTFYPATVDGREVLAPHAWAPSAQAMSLVYWAPNHVRAWRRTIYQALGGHEPTLAVGDDHELLARTYLFTRMVHVPEILYLYRVDGANTWAGRIEEIRRESLAIRDRFLHRLVERECALRGLQRYDLGGAHGCPPGWQGVDLDAPHADLVADLRERWPFEDGSVGAFRAFDLLEHLPDRLHTMREIHRCLAPGGWLLSMTPSTDGRGAFQDPTHVAYWNQNSFWYWTRTEQARYLRAQGIERPLFVESRLFTACPSAWHEEHRIPYVTADLWALKGDCSHLPYERV